VNELAVVVPVRPRGISEGASAYAAIAVGESLALRVYGKTPPRSLRSAGTRCSPPCRRYRA
jgi:hypothetical protein